MARLDVLDMQYVCYIGSEQAAFSVHNFVLCTSFGEGIFVRLRVPRARATAFRLVLNQGSISGRCA